MTYGYKPILQDKMRVLFIGINPCVNCVKNGYFSNNKSFWVQLARAGIVPGIISDKQIKKYKYGIMNLSDYVADDPKYVPKKEWNKGVERVSNVLTNHEVDIVCSVGKLPIKKILGIDNIDYGWSNYIFYGTRIFVMMFPTHRSSREEKLNVLFGLKVYLDSKYDDVRNNFGQTKIGVYIDNEQ